MDSNMISMGQLQGGVSSTNYIQNFQVPMSHNLGRNIHCAREHIPQNMMNTRMQPVMMTSHDDLRNALQLIIPRDIEVVPLHQDRGPQPSQMNQIFTDRRPWMSHNQTDTDNIVMPMPFQIKTEQVDDYYETTPDSTNITHNEQSPFMQNMQMDNTHFMYYSQNSANMNQINNSAMEIAMRQQPFIQNFPVQNHNSQNVRVEREHDNNTQLNFNDKRVTVKIEQHNNIVNNTNNRTCEEKNENDSSCVNKIQDDESDDTVLKECFNNIKGEFVCYKCNDKFDSKRSFKQHLKACVDKEGKFGCVQCTYKCHSAAILKIHERTHTGEKPFSCRFCDYKSGQKNNVAKHMMVHMKEKPFHCQFCDYRCAQKNNLVVHERTHTGYKPFACTFCDYRTVQKPNLVKHLYLHTDKKPFSCDICNYRCVQKTNLTKHMRRHIPAKATTDGESKQLKQCDHCKYKCIQQLSMDKHVQLKHGKLLIAQNPDNAQNLSMKQPN